MFKVKKTKKALLLQEIMWSVIRVKFADKIVLNYQDKDSLQSKLDYMYAKKVRSAFVRCHEHCTGNLIFLDLIQSKVD